MASEYTFLKHSGSCISAASLAHTASMSRSAHFRSANGQGLHAPCISHILSMLHTAVATLSSVGACRASSISVHLKEQHQWLLTVGRSSMPTFALYANSNGKRSAWVISASWNALCADSCTPLISARFPERIWSNHCQTRSFCNASTTGLMSSSCASRCHISMRTGRVSAGASSLDVRCLRSARTGPHGDWNVQADVELSFSRACSRAALTALPAATRNVHSMELELEAECAVAVLPDACARSASAPSGRVCPRGADSRLANCL